jgi:hypothetical protein
MEGKEVYGRSFYGRWGIDLEGSWILQRGVEFWSEDCISQAPGLLEVLGTGARISI